MLIEPICLFLFLLLGDALSMPLGGVLYMLVGLSLAIPYLGRALNLLLNGVKLSVVVKLVAWCISSSGLLGGLLLFQVLFGPPDTAFEWWILASIALYVLLRGSHRIVMFDVYNIMDSLRGVSNFSPPFLKAGIRRLESSEISTIMRRNFADMNFIPLLQLLTSLGILLFALTNLRLLPTSAGASPSLVSCMATSLSLIGLGPSDAVVFVGPVWLLIRLFIGIVLLVWVVAFISVALDSIPGHAEARLALGLSNQESQSFEEYIDPKSYHEQAEGVKVSKGGEGSKESAEVASSRICVSSEASLEQPKLRPEEPTKESSSVGKRRRREKKPGKVPDTRQEDFS